MSDRNERHKRVALRLVGHPLVVAPAAVGMGAVILSLLGGIGGGILTFAGIVAILSALGISLYRLLFKLKSISDETMQDIQREVEQAKSQIILAEQKELDDLYDRLTGDHDTRDEDILADLRTIVRGFNSNQAWFQKVHPEIVTNLKEKVSQLEKLCIDRLRRSVELRDMARSLQTSARVELETARETLIAEAAMVPQQLSKLLADVQTLGIKLIAETGKDSIADIIERIGMVIQTTGEIQGVFEDEQKKDAHDKFRARFLATREAEQAEQDSVSPPLREKTGPNRA